MSRTETIEWIPVEEGMPEDAGIATQSRVVLVTVASWEEATVAYRDYRWDRGAKKRTGDLAWFDVLGTCTFPGRIVAWAEMPRGME